MGAGASLNISSMVQEGSVDDIKAVLAGLPEESLEKIKSVMSATSGSPAFGDREHLLAPDYEHLVIGIAHPEETDSNVNNVALEGSKEDSLLGKATQSMRVYVQRLADAEPLRLNVEAGNTLAQVKSMIQVALGLEPWKQKLVQELTPIEGDDKSLQEFGVKGGAVLTLVITQPPQFDKPCPPLLEFKNGDTSVSSERNSIYDYQTTTSKMVCPSSCLPQWTLRIDKYNSNCYMAFGVADATVKRYLEELGFTKHTQHIRDDGPTCASVNHETGRTWAWNRCMKSDTHTHRLIKDLADPPKSGDIVRVAVLNEGKEVVVAINGKEILGVKDAGLEGQQVCLVHSLSGELMQTTLVDFEMLAEPL